MSVVEGGYLAGHSSVTLLWQKTLATSFIRHRVRTGEARRLRTALRRWARLLYSKAFSALHLAPKKASPGRVTAAVQHPPHSTPTGLRLSPGALKKGLLPPSLDHTASAPAFPAQGRHW